MGDVDENIDYIKSLRKGFDKDLFQSKIEELAYIVDTVGLEYEDFHTLFKVWLNLTLPITKWVNLGSCLAPSDIVERRTVEYALRWILSNFHDPANNSRVAFLVDWLTVAMEFDCIDMSALDLGYDIFYTMLTYEMLAAHALKLVYTLTKPVDVTRKKVLDLIRIAKVKDGQKNASKPLQVLLMLFKSYKPECVPEDIPAIPIYTAFRKTNKNLLTRFRITRDRRSRSNKDREQLMWINPINCMKGNKRTEPLVPNVEFVSSARHTSEGDTINNFLDFSDPASVIQHSVQRGLSRPARLRALLCNHTGQTLLALHSHTEQAFLAHNLTHLLNSCFLEVSPYSYAEKRDLLQKLATFQRTLVQGIPAVTAFLAHYLPFWNERDYFPEILQLLEWVSVERPEHVEQIAARMSAVYLRAPPLEQCAIVRALTYMYTNLVYSSTRSRQHFGASVPRHGNYAAALPALAAALAATCHAGLQVDPDDLRVLYMSVWSALRRARAEKGCGVRAGGALSPLNLALPLLAASPALLDGVAELIILYRKIMSTNSGNEGDIQMIGDYLIDLLNCLYSEEALSKADTGLIFKRLPPQLVDKLGYLMPDVDAKLSLRNHLAFAPYTYMQAQDDIHRDDNKVLFHSVIETEFPRLGLLMKKTAPVLCYR